MKRIIDISDKEYELYKLWAKSDNLCSPDTLMIANSLPYEDNWIPVSERLPEGMGTYLVTLEYKEHGKGVTTLWYPGEGIGWDLPVADVVIAWQPLPEPYMKGDAE